MQAGAPAHSSALGDKSDGGVQRVAVQREKKKIKRKTRYDIIEKVVMKGFQTQASWEVGRGESWRGGGMGKEQAFYSAQLQEKGTGDGA